MRNCLPSARFLLPLATVAFLTVAGCKKDKKDDPAPTPAPANRMTYKLNGRAITASVSTQRSGTELAMTGLSDGAALYVALGNVTGVMRATDAFLVYTEGSLSWSSLPGQAGVASDVRITAYDSVARKMSGTFTATLPAQTGTGATGTKTITEGVFTNVGTP